MDYKYGDTNESVAQGPLKGQGGAGGGAGGTDGLLYSGTNTAVSQGVSAASSINTGQNNSTTLHSADNRDAIYGKLGKAGMCYTAKEL